jgi:hypothetical protein
MKRLLFVFLMMTCSVSFAEWEVTGKSDGRRITNYHDKSSIRRNGSQARMWGLEDHSVVRVNSSGKEYKSIKILKIFDCVSEEFEIISYVEHFESMGYGKVVSSDALEKKEWKWFPIVPGSVVEKEWKIACGKK